MSRGPVVPPPAKGEGVVMVMLPPCLWDVGWTVERPIEYTVEGPPLGVWYGGAHGMRHT